MDTMTLPQWLVPEVDQSTTLAPSHNPRYPRTVAEKEMRNSALEGVFWRSLETVSSGGDIGDFLSTVESVCPRITPEEFFQFIRRDPTRRTAYAEAEEIGTELLMGQLVPIADGDSRYCSPDEDSNLKRLRLDARKYRIEKHYKKKYGNDTSTSTPFAGGITVVIGDVKPTVTTVVPPQRNIYDHDDAA